MLNYLKELEQERQAMLDEWEEVAGFLAEKYSKKNKNKRNRNKERKHA